MASYLAPDQAGEVASYLAPVQAGKVASYLAPDQAGKVASYQRGFVLARCPVDRAVDEPVDKRHSLGRTRRVLWMNCGWLKNLGTGDRILLCGPRPRA